MNFKKLSLTLLIISTLSACTEDNAKQCDQLFHFDNKPALARPYCEKAASEGNVNAQTLFARILLEEGQKEQAVILLEKSANQKDGMALFTLGEIYEKGRIGEQNFDKALFYYRKSCEASHIKGCEQLNMLDKQIAENQQQAEKEAEQLAEEKRLEEERQAFEQQRLLEEQRLERERLAIAAEKQRLLAEQAKMAKQNQTSEQTEEQAITTGVVEKSEQVAAVKSTAETTKNSGELKFYEGLASYQENGLYGFVNKNGEVIIPLKFLYAGRFSHQRAAVQDQSGLWGFIDSKGNYVVKPKYCSVAAFSESDGLAGVYEGGQKVGDKCEGGKWGFMDKNGKWVIEPVLDYAERFIKGKAKVTYQGKTGYVDTEGKWLD